MHGHLVRLLAQERSLQQDLTELRSRIDDALATNRITAYKALAYDIILALGLADTADELERVAAALKKRASKARRRCRAVTAGHRQSVVEHGPAAHHHDMSNPYLRKRIIEEYGPPPDGDLGDPEDLNGADDEFDDDDDDDHDLGDPSDGGPAPGQR